MNLQESGEMYLKTILLLTREKNTVRAVDITKALNYNKSSISRALRHLKDAGFLTVSRRGRIQLTGEGTVLAERIYARYTALRCFLTALGVDTETADTDACRLEHDISEETADALNRFLISNELVLSENGSVFLPFD